MGRPQGSKNGERTITTCLKHNELRILRGKKKEGVCRSCNKERSANWNKKHPRAFQKWLYGISESEYQELFLRQNESCAICLRPQFVVGTLAVDHNHTTGEIRGLLCRPCNCALGLFQENDVVVQVAANYLRGAK